MRSGEGDTDYAGNESREWRRSDDRIWEDVNVELLRQPGLDATDIDVRVKEGEVRLTGTVIDKSSKRMAEDIAESVPGVTDVLNELRIKREGDSAEASAGRPPDRDVTRPAERDGRQQDTPPPAGRSEPDAGSPEPRAD